ncbi:hypothetical protein GGX14DRAFT_610686 [Mycena pura]|uniref:Uncharacterized protein n=1 Tax=Mycena pura TaxID=153505 RepID=A0AAD6YHP0_9AGAR|nr:hypothetical protein GGX14DRAFT_610686 [Mycena pura]
MDPESSPSSRRRTASMRAPQPPPSDQAPMPAPQSPPSNKASPPTPLASQEESSPYYPSRSAPAPHPYPYRHPHQSPPPVSHEAVLALTFVLQRQHPTILNCTVVGADGCTPYFHIMTTAAAADASPERTVFRANSGRTLATVDWGTGTSGRAGAAPPQVEVHKVLRRQPLAAWLGVSYDASYRIMHAPGHRYVWVPQKHSICMYDWNGAAGPQMYAWNDTAHQPVPRLLARIEQVDEKTTLEIAVDAIHPGLLEMVVVATTVFQSGCSID